MREEWVRRFGHYLMQIPVPPPNPYSNHNNAFHRPDYNLMHTKLLIITYIEASDTTS